MCTAIEEMVHEGEERGERRGERRYNQLLKKLLEENRTKDILRMTEDQEFRKKLFREETLEK